MHVPEHFTKKNKKKKRTFIKQRSTLQRLESIYITSEEKKSCFLFLSSTWWTSSTSEASGRDLLKGNPNARLYFYF